jgi:hypothetical protein
VYYKEEEIIMDKDFKKRLKVLIIPILIFIGSINYNNIDRNVYEIKKSAYLRITLDGRTMCTAIVVNETTAVSSMHCNVQNVIIQSEDHEIKIDNAQITQFSNKYDFMVMKGDFRKFNSIAKYTYDYSNYRVPRNARSCGYAFGGKLLCVYIKDIKTIGPDLMGNGTLIPGMSGGALVYNNKIIGINKEYSNQVVDTVFFAGMFGVNVDEKND